MKTFFILILVCCGNLLYSQSNAIVGIIIDSENQQPVTGCNVFISNTSIGKVTDSAGKFRLYDIAESKSYDLVVSSAGYETFTYNFSSKQLPLNLKVSLHQKVIEMENVTVFPVETDGWVKWGHLFFICFIGESENAAECDIVNSDKIKFRRNKKDDLLEASADGVLIINNNRLGYVIKYQLEQFVYDFKQQSITYLGYPLFEEMENPPQPKYIRRRIKAYNGSLMHFFRSLYANMFVEEGFEVRPMTRTAGIDTIKNYGRYAHLTMVDSDGKKIQAPKYYLKKVIRENYGNAILSNDSLLSKGTESVKDILVFNDYLCVRYLKEPEPVEFSRKFADRAAQKNQLTKFSISNEEKSILIQPDGYYYPSLDLLIEGYLGWEKVGDMLPLDYILPPNIK